MTQRSNTLNPRASGQPGEFMTLHLEKVSLETHFTRCVTHRSVIYVDPRLTCVSSPANRDKCDLNCGMYVAKYKIWVTLDMGRYMMEVRR